MVNMSWDLPSQRFYEAGVDRGVLFVNGGEGVPWSGLVSVKESSDGAGLEPYYIDGVKYLMVSQKEEFSATVDALYSPPEFDACDGSLEVRPGLSATQQIRASFGLSYRTMLGNDTEGLNLGYKIHLVYNAMAEPTDRSRDTLDDSAKAMLLSWKLSTVPVLLPGFAPSSHFVLDSREDPIFLSWLEDQIYGTPGTPPRLPLPSEIVAYQPAGYDSSLYDVAVYS